MKAPRPTAIYPLPLHDALPIFAARYGPFDHPAWLRAVTTHVAPLATHVRPASFQWARVSNPYAGGDPISYLRFARSEEHTSELQSQSNFVCRLLLEKKNTENQK